MTWPFSTKVLCKLTLQLLEGALVWAIHSTNEDTRAVQNLSGCNLLTCPYL